MPRDSGGTYSLPDGNPVVSGTTVSSTWANNTMDDVAEALTNSLSRDGEGGMLAPMMFADGTEADPGITWTSEDSTGFYMAALGDMRLSVLASDLFRWYDDNAYVWDDVNAVWQKVVAANTIEVDTSGNVTFQGDVTIDGDLILSTGGSFVVSVVAGTNVTVDNTDPANPIVSASGGGGGSLSIITTTQVANFNAVAGFFYIIDPVTAAATIVMTLPTGPAAGDVVGYVVITPSATYNATVTSPDSTINGDASITEDSSLGVIGMTMVFNGSQWIIYETANRAQGVDALLLES